MVSLKRAPNIPQLAGHLRGRNYPHALKRVKSGCEEISTTCSELCVCSCWATLLFNRRTAQSLKHLVAADFHAVVLQEVALLSAVSPSEREFQRSLSGVVHEASSICHAVDVTRGKPEQHSQTKTSSWK